MIEIAFMRIASPHGGTPSGDKAQALRPIAFNLRQSGVQAPLQTGEV